VSILVNEGICSLTLDAVCLGEKKIIKKRREKEYLKDTCAQSKTLKQISKNNVVKKKYRREH
jgi:hypothetical protein